MQSPAHHGGYLSSPKIIPSPPFVGWVWALGGIVLVYEELKKKKSMGILVFGGLERKGNG